MPITIRSPGSAVWERELDFSILAPKVRLPPRLAAVLQRLPPVLAVLWVLTLPLEFTKRYFPTSQLGLSRLVLGLCVLTLAAQVVLERKPLRIPASVSFLGICVFIAYAAMSALISGSRAGDKTVLAILAYFLMMLAIFNWARTSADHIRLWTALAVSALVLALLGIGLYATGTYIWNPPSNPAAIARVNATFFDPNIFARFLAFSIVAAIPLVADLDLDAPRRMLVLAGGLCAAVAIPFTFSRAGWAFTVIVMVVAVVFARRRLSALAVGGAMVAMFLAVAIIYPPVVGRAAVLAQNLETPFTAPIRSDQAPWLHFLTYLPLDSVRHYLIGSGLIMFVDHPIFGVGFGRFPAALSGPYAALIPQGFHTTASHTSLVTVLAETGLVGFVIIAFAAVTFVRSMWKACVQSPRQRALGLAASLGLLMVVLESQFSGRLFDEPYLWLFLGLAFGAQAGLDNLKARTSSGIREPEAAAPA